METDALLLPDQHSMLVLNTLCLLSSTKRGLWRQTEAETDELLLVDEDMLDADPEQLPRRLLSDFAIYNAEARRYPSAPAPACPLLSGAHRPLSSAFA